MKKQTKQTVRLREKLLKNGNKSLYLDIWHQGKRKYEFLKIYLVKPKNQKDRDNNKKLFAQAEEIRAKRQLDLKNSEYGLNSYDLDVNFIEYFKQLIEERKNSKGNHGNWQSALIHLIDFCSVETKFKDIDEKFVKDFKKYLETKAVTKSLKPLSINSQHSYFNKFRAAINQAFNENLIPRNPVKSIETIKAETTQREYLTLEELKLIAKTDCKMPVLKRAFLFSCLTGIRWSDINKLVWSEVQKFNDGHRVVFRQKKTKGMEYLDISNQAFSYLGERQKSDERVFKGLKYSGYINYVLKEWVYKAGIQKDITFHCARHTFAVIQLDMGTSIYTVSKLLGHSEMRTTQIYAKILDKKKIEAVNKIPDINI